MNDDLTDIIPAALMAVMVCLLLFGIFGLVMSIRQSYEVGEKCAAAGGERMRGRGNTTYCIVNGKVVDMLGSNR